MGIKVFNYYFHHFKAIRQKEGSISLLESAKVRRMTNKLFDDFFSPPFLALTLAPTKVGPITIVSFLLLFAL